MTDSAGKASAGGAGDRAERDRAVPTWLAVVSVIVLVAGLAALGVFGSRYAEARSAQEVASEREAVSEVATQVVINAFSFDHRDVDDSLQQLADASTGAFLAEQEQWAEDVRTRVVEQKAVTTATPSQTAVEVLDLEAGDAAVLVVFTAHSEREGQDDITGRQAMRVDLTRVDDEWKADAVNQVGVTVPVGTSSQSVQELEAPQSEEGPSDTADNDTEEESSTAPTTSAGR
ncbi:hypothetical protein [Rhodococcus sp. IEGM 1408]|uniref:hypothetical protein n=1 Tax=Rhodococcus sp. IEGM 1408 TaxID=3082220 RepID=UPI0029542C6D|nr:hypothetical protein [Rhodococcus sp. IEGM 1408]MDV8001288.1 hypothetical protein [Rhodococcus sp. IEGM 1408]